MTTPTLAFRLTPHLEMRISPALVAYAELLQCPASGLDDAITREIERNPALDRPPRVADRRECPRCGFAGRCGRCHGGLPMAPAATDGYLSAGSAMTRDQVLADARPDLAPEDQALAGWILGDLDPRGFLPGGVAGAAAVLGVDEDRVCRIVEVLRAAGPPGLCASGIPECLLLQVAAYEETGDAPPLLRALVEDHLPALAAGRLGAIAAALRVDQAEVLAARRFLQSRLRPWVALDDGPPAVPVSRPDVVISYAADGSGRLEIRISDDPGALCAVDPLWERLSDGGDAGALSRAERLDVRERVRRARAFVAALSERADTLCLVAGYVAGRQRRFLSDGAAAHEPLTRAEVAAQLGLHESTVSRAVAGKQVRLPDGRTVAFADLFGANGSAQATLQAIVAAEPRALSDTELAAELAGRGYPVARRTVAKYRGQLGIPSCAVR